MSKLIKYQPLISLSLLTLLNSVAIIGLTTTVIAPEIALAEILQVTISLSRQQNETYPEFLRRAEGLAGKTIQNRFNQDKSLSDLRVVAIGENQGAIAPVLALTISRQNWLNKPNVQFWATYFVDSQLLLGFQEATTKVQPAATPSTSPNASQSGGETKKPESSSQPPKKPTETKKPPSPPLNDEPPVSPATPPQPDNRLKTPAKIQEQEQDNIINNN